MVQPLWKTVWWFLKKLSIELACDPAVLLLSVHPGELKAGVQAGACTGGTGSQSRYPPTDEWIRQCGVPRQWNIIQPQKGME